MDCIPTARFETTSDASLRISIVDPDYRRRATVGYWLASTGLNVQPFETIDEFVSGSRHCGIALVADVDGRVEELIDHPANRQFHIPFIAYCDEIAVHRVVAAIHGGAIDYLAWPPEQSDLPDSLIAVDRRWHDFMWPRRKDYAVDSHPRDLTEREREVLDKFSGGMTGDTICRELGISPRTLAVHRSNINRKLGIKLSAASPLASFNGGLSTPAASPATSDTPAGPAPDQLVRHLEHLLESNERKEYCRNLLARLSQRELQVLGHVAKGLSSKQIAQIMNISARTVDSHRFNLVGKLDASNIALAIRIAADGGLV